MREVENMVCSLSHESDTKGYQIAAVPLLSGVLFTLEYTE